MLSFVHVKPPIKNFELPTCLLCINSLKPVRLKSGKGGFFIWHRHQLGLMFPLTCQKALYYRPVLTITSSQKKNIKK